MLVPKVPSASRTRRASMRTLRIAEVLKTNSQPWNRKKALSEKACYVEVIYLCVHCGFMCLPNLFVWVPCAVGLYRPVTARYGASYTTWGRMSLWFLSKTGAEVHTCESLVHVIQLWGPSVVITSCALEFSAIVSSRFIGGSL